MLSEDRDLLVTTSLIGAVEWFLNSPTSIDRETGKSWKDKAYESLVSNLKREFNPSKEILRGMAFEKQINAAITLPTKEDFLSFFSKEAHCDDILKFYTEGRGAQQQKTLKKIVTIKGQSYCLYGKADLYFPEIIKDIKTSKVWKGRKAYLSTTQHLMYCYIEKIPQFRYIVAVFGDKEKDVCTEVQTVDFLADMGLIEKQLFDRIESVMGLIEADSDLKDLYLNKFCLY